MNTILSMIFALTAFMFITFCDGSSSGEKQDRADDYTQVIMHGYEELHQADLDDESSSVQILPTVDRTVAGTIMKCVETNDVHIFVTNWRNLQGSI